MNRDEAEKFISSMKEVTGRTALPALFIGGMLVGGVDGSLYIELKLEAGNGKLAARLKRAKVMAEAISRSRR
jgi:phage terminase large subunit-like protein